MRQRWRELVLSLVSIGIALLLAELGVRMYMRHRARADLKRMDQQATVTGVDSCHLGDIVRRTGHQEPYYELKPNLRGRYCGGSFSTNALGMRMRGEPSIEKPPGVLRIAALGDSYSFGQGVDDGQGYADLISGTHAGNGKKLETLNFGVPGYNAWMEAVVLTTRARKYAPDVILVTVMGNDWDLPSFMMTRPYGSFRHSFVLGALKDRLRGARSVRTPRSAAEEGFALPSEVPEAFRHMVGFESYRRALGKILRTAEESHAKVVLFSDCISQAGPSGPSCSFPFAAGEYERIRAEVYEHPRVSVCSWKLEASELIPRDGHPTPRGHRRLADRLRACLSHL